MRKQQAFNSDKKLLKGNLHCHTTRSDGRISPDEIIRLYKQNGYDFLAITDHRKYNYQNFAPDVDITIIPGMEFDSTFDNTGYKRCFHTVCIGPAKEDGNGYDQDQTFARGISTCQEEYQPYLDDIHAKKNLTIYAHPQWSSTPPRYFDKLQGDFAIEIWNSICAIEHDMDKDAAYWDDLLGIGKKIYGVATDDCHKPNHPCNGWVMVNADNNINSILDALKNGAFYSSCGPEIYDFYEEDGAVHIECSDAVMIKFMADKHPSEVIRGNTDSPISGAELNINNSYNYIRAEIIDSNGKKAWTNPIFFDGRE